MQHLLDRWRQTGRRASRDHDDHIRQFEGGLPDSQLAQGYRRNSSQRHGIELRQTLPSTVVVPFKAAHARMIEDRSISGPSQKLSHGIAVRFRGVIKSYGEGDTKVTALRGVDLEVRQGELLMIVGPSGRRRDLPHKLGRGSRYDK